MACKRPSPLAASSSQEQEEASSEAASGSESEPKKTTKKKPQQKKPESAAKTQDYSSGESESESESEAVTLTERRENVKPIASKPMEKATKPRSKVPASPAKSGKKRAGDECEMTKDLKKAKKKRDEPEEDGVEEESKKSKLFQRIWSDEDEIIILKGMNEFKTKKGDPYADMNAFHHFIKNSLKIDVSKIQLQDKIRRMKKKFENNVRKKQKVTKVHDRKTFELSKKLWGSEGDEDLAGQVTKSNGNATLYPAKEAEKSEAFSKPGVSYSLREVALDKGFKAFGLSESFVKQGLELIGGAKRAELENRWSKLHLSGLELFVQKTELMRDQANLIVEAFKKSDH